ncbi:hypothetical protein EUTSA_v10015428mg [Eutrema salsugineum]|uniref:F-box domain-containing protein n=1 Tax=Eutrema salsugineum TaxID=72664 RepID=V4NB75_EUTSA|nr:F-box/FBD/LRR-repeat protein At1g51370 [Eutrema salsugineum]ESQ43136.1 hypothetical protein EUTSA_v10015428mg [Eutrema salsugineum]
MVGRKKKTKTCDKGSQEDMISKLPDPLISEILYHLPTKDAVSTSVLSTKWRNHWQCVPGLDLDSRAFSNLDAFMRFVGGFLESSMIRKLRLSNHFPDSITFLTLWFDVLTAQRRIQHLDLDFAIYNYYDNVIPQSIYTCESLVHLRLCRAVLAITEFIFLPCLKIMHLDCCWYSKEATSSLEKLISASPVMEDLTIFNMYEHREKVIQVRSNTLKRIHIDHSIQVVIDAPLLQCLNAKFTKSDLDMLPTILESCPKLESLILELVKDPSRKKNTEAKVMFSTVPPQCLVSSLKYVELKRLIPRYEGEIELVRYLLKNSTILETLKLEKKAMRAFIKEVVAMPRCSSACKVLVL